MPLTKIVHCMLFIWLVVAWICPPATHADNMKKKQLQRIMADIALLNNQLEQRKNDAADTRSKLSRRMDEIRKEVLGEIRSAKIRNEAEALAHPRVHYDLMLIAEIQAYVDRYTDRINYYRIATDRLTYLYQQADDDLKIINTLSDIKIDALMAQAEKVLDGYLSDAQTIVAQPATLAIQSPEAVWKTLESRM